MAVDAQGNVYIADPVNHRVREVSGGTITTIAGNGSTGFSGDGGPATSAQLSTPLGVAVDAHGNVSFADTGNNRVRKVSGGTITTIAGTGTAGFSRDGGPASSAQLNQPVGVAVDAAGNVYITDNNNQRVRKVTETAISPLLNGRITTIAGTGSAGFSGDSGPATSAQLYYPQAVAVDAQGNVYIADTNNFRVRKVRGGTISTTAGDGTEVLRGMAARRARRRSAFPMGWASARRGTSTSQTSTGCARSRTSCRRRRSP